MFCLKTLQNVDAQIAKHRRHRWINILIRSGDAMAARLKHARKRSHGRAANADQVVVLRRQTLSLLTV